MGILMMKKNELQRCPIRFRAPVSFEIYINSNLLAQKKNNNESGNFELIYL
tara:strand:+ start:26 stop:178 length:153 start_codon:yes stop_codon:yes gene_type:complete